MIYSYCSVNKCETNKINQTKRYSCVVRKGSSLLFSGFSGGKYLTHSLNRFDLALLANIFHFMEALKKKKYIAAEIANLFVKRSCFSFPLKH